MKNEALQQLDGLIGDWKLTMANAWFIEDTHFKGNGSATIAWLGEAFIELRRHSATTPARGTGSSAAATPGTSSRCSTTMSAASSASST